MAAVVVASGHDKRASVSILHHSGGIWNSTQRLSAFRLSLKQRIGVSESTLLLPLTSVSQSTNMEPGNNTQISEFLLLGISEKLELQPLLLGLFLSMYLITVFGNLLIILAVSADSHLLTPMYFFLCNLSFVDICLTSTIIPKMLLNIQTQSKAITYAGCISQMYFFLFFAGLDDFLLTVMAYDRLGVYLSSAVTSSSPSSATASVMYTVVTPMLNPFIYSLRNKDIKGALKRLIVKETKGQ
ncbi:Olfactory Receptor 7A5 [Manis pentadactyla]|nr:Olfactory Receptor 7A5 [Manis pentadactyla]